MTKRARARESTKTGTNYDPQYERYLAPSDTRDPRSLVTLDRLLRREVEGKNPWHDIAWAPMKSGEKPYWQGVPVYTALSTTNVACALGDRLLFCKDPYVAFFSAVAALTRKRMSLKDDALWRRFILTASSIEKKPFKDVWKALTKEHAALFQPPLAPQHDGLRMIYYGLLGHGWRGFRGPLLSLMRALPWPVGERESAKRLMEIDRTLRDVIEDVGYTTEKLDLSYPLVGADLVGADFSNKEIPERGLDQYGRWMDFDEEYVTTKDLSLTDLSFADLRYSWLNSADFRRTPLAFANLTGSDLTAANFAEADLRMTVLPKKSLASFTNALRLEADPPVQGWVVKDGRMARV